jgi:hypothetical protein
VVILLLLLSAAGSALAWWVTWIATHRSDAAWFAWAAITLPVTSVFHSFAVYPDGPGGILALTGVWALLRAEDERASGSERTLPWFCHGLALSILPWLHARFAVLAGGFGALILLRLSTTRNAASKAAVFLSIPAVSAIAWIGFFIALYGTPDPSSPYSPGQSGSMAFVASGLGGLLFDQRFGLLPYAPVLAFAFAGLAMMVARPGSRRLGLELLFVMIPYLLTVTHFAMWWGGGSAPARFFVPVLSLLAIPAGMFWIAVERPGRSLAIAALVFTTLTTAAVVAIDRGRLAFNGRDTPALWLEWASRAADLPKAVPAWSRGADGPFYRDIGIWVGTFAAALFGVHAARSKFRSRTAYQIALAWALSISVTVASALVWFIRGVDGRKVASAQFRLLHDLAARRRAIALDLDRLRAIDVSSMPQRLLIEFSRQVSSPRASTRDDRPLFEVPRMPAGEYRLTPVADEPRGWIMLGIGRQQFALRTVPIPTPPQAIDLRFPIAIRNIVVRGDEDARQTVKGLTVQPIDVPPQGRWGDLIALTAVKYARAVVFFLDERSFPEPEAFWVGGARSSSLVIGPDVVRSTVELLMRNGPVANHVSVDAAGQRTDYDLEPEAEQRLTVPIEQSRGAALLTVSVVGGFRPSEHEPGSRDTRFLGVWMKVN